MSPKRKIYEPGQADPYKLSRSQIESFLQCPRCFYLYHRFGIRQPGGFPLTLNNAVDHLLKKEFDQYREKQLPHPLMTEYEIDAVPYSHTDIEKWRNNWIGVQTLHRETNFLVFGAIDDVWKSKNGELLIVDYKATSKNGEIALDQPYHESYKRQIEIYQWLFRENGFAVSSEGYFVFANASKDYGALDGSLIFKLSIILHQGDSTWVNACLKRARTCLDSKTLPSSEGECAFCNYRRQVTEAL